MGQGVGVGVGVGVGGYIQLSNLAIESRVLLLLSPLRS